MRATRPRARRPPPGTTGRRTAVAEAAPAAATGNRVSVKLIDSNPAQPRQEFDPEEMRSLVESLSAHGLLQPLVVRKAGERYQLVAGERRLRAAVQAGWADVPVTVVEADDRQMAELAIVENLQRKDLSPLEKAASFQKYLDQYQCTQEELAGRLKIDRSTIANLIRLLELPLAVQDSLRRKQITQGHARALLPLGDEQEQIDFCQRIQREGLNVRQTESMVQEMIDKADHDPLVGEPAAAPSKPARAVARQERADYRPGARVAIGPWPAGLVASQCPRPRPAGDPVSQSRGIRAAQEANLRRVSGHRRLLPWQGA